MISAHYLMGLFVCLSQYMELYSDTSNLNFISAKTCVSKESSLSFQRVLDFEYKPIQAENIIHNIKYI